MADSSEDHTLGIHGKLQHVVADANHETATLIVNHTLGDDLTASSHISQENLRKAACVSHTNLLNADAVTVTTHNLSGGVAAVTIKGGDDKPITVTNRHCMHTPNGGMVASHVIALPNQVTSSDKMHLKELPTDTHNYTRPENVSPQDAERNKLNAVYYAAHDGPPGDDHLFKDTIEASHNGLDRIAVPIYDKISSDHGGLSAVASRCLKLQKKRVADLVPNGNGKIVQMPHKITGDMVEHLVADAPAIRSMAATVKSNTQVQGTFAKGLKISTNGLENSKPGDQLITTVTIHRKPTSDPTKVVLQKELMAKEVAAGTIHAGGADVAVSGRQQDWHNAMFSHTKGAKDATPQIAAASTDAQAMPATPSAEGEASNP